jgi:hypothetical protein
MVKYYQGTVIIFLRGKKKYLESRKKIYLIFLKKRWKKVEKAVEI